jgi:hypothetical protein
MDIWWVINSPLLTHISAFYMILFSYRFRPSTAGPTTAGSEDFFSGRLLRSAAKGHSEKTSPAEKNYNKQ